MFELARLALSAVLAAALQIAVLGRPAAAAPVSELDPKPAALLSEAGPHSADPASTYSDNPVPTEFLIADRLAAPSVRDFPAVRAVGHLLQSREFELISLSG